MTRQTSVHKHWTCDTLKDNHRHQHHHHHHHHHHSRHNYHKINIIIIIIINHKTNPRCRSCSSWDCQPRTPSTRRRSSLTPPHPVLRGWCRGVFGPSEVPLEPFHFLPAENFLNGVSEKRCARWSRPWSLEGRTWTDGWILKGFGRFGVSLCPCQAVGISWSMKTSRKLFSAPDSPFGLWGCDFEKDRISWMTEERNYSSCS